MRVARSLGARRLKIPPFFRTPSPAPRGAFSLLHYRHAAHPGEHRAMDAGAVFRGHRAAARHGAASLGGGFSIRSPGARFLRHLSTALPVFRPALLVGSGARPMTLSKAAFALLL